MPVRLFSNTPYPSPSGDEARIYSAKTARSVIDVMDATLHGGTGQSIFARGKYKKLRNIVGGKTGTLTGRSPQGLTTLFAGLAPLDAPEVAVASIVILDNHWRIKATTLAAEAFHAYFDKKLNAQRFDTAASQPIARGDAASIR